MQTFILGTAGHVDHGKTTLVRALTGTDTDRLEEEHRRGISIELGFAELELNENLRMGVIDVPGHERFVRQMVAGAGGMDLAMLLVAADEGVMPQTREHLDVLRLLGVRAGLVVLTKSDLADPDLAAVVEEEVRDLVADSFLADAPLLHVSASTGAGIEELKQTLIAIAESLPPRARGGDFRLPLDRVFALPGAGVVVTGTAWSGTIKPGDQLRLLPNDEDVRVREIQSHSKAAEAAGAGERVAVSLARIKKDELERGDQLVTGRAWEPATILGVRITAVEDLNLARRLRPRAALHVHHAAREVDARLDLLDHDGPLAAGQSVVARLLLDEPLIAAPGDRLVLRTWSPMITAAGAVVIEPQGRSGERRRESLRRYTVLENADEFAWAFRKDAPPKSGVSLEELHARLRMCQVEDPESVVQQRVKAKRLVVIGEVALDRAALDDLVERMLVLLRAHQSSAPMSPGLGTAELKQALGFEGSAALFGRVLQWAAQESPLFLKGERIRVDSAQPELGGEQAAGLAEMEDRVRDADPMFQASDTDLKDPRLRLLMDQGVIEKLDTRLFAHSDDLAKLKQRVSGHFDTEDSLELKQLKEWTGASRKYVVPLAEWLDRNGITRNQGGVRSRGPKG